MIAFLVICYSAFYWLLFIKLKLLEKNARNISVFVGVGLVNRPGIPGAVH